MKKLVCYSQLLEEVTHEREIHFRQRGGFEVRCCAWNDALLSRAVENREEEIPTWQTLVYFVRWLWTHQDIQARGDRAEWGNDWPAGTNGCVRPAPGDERFHNGIHRYTTVKCTWRHAHTQYNTKARVSNPLALCELFRCSQCYVQCYNDRLQS